MSKVGEKFPHFILILTCLVSATLCIQSFLIKKEEWEIYYLFFISLSIGTLLLTFSKTSIKFKQNISLVIISTFFSILLIELCLQYGETFLYTIKGKKYLTERYNAPNIEKFDPRSQIEYVNDSRKQGKTIWPWYGSYLVGISTQIDFGNGFYPLSGISNSSILYCNEAGTYQTYESDEHGFNNPKGAYSKKVDLAILGDSFTEGACVPADKNYVSQMRIGHKNILNFGKSGHGPLAVLATFKEYVEVLKPKEVIYAFYEGNDLYDLALEYKNPILRKYLNNANFTQALFYKQKEIDAVISKKYLSILSDPKALPKLRRPIEKPIYWQPEEKENILKLNKFKQIFHSEITKFLFYKKGNIYADANGFEGFNKPLQDKFVQILNIMKNRTKEWGGTIYFVYLPEWSRYRYPFHGENMRNVYLQKLSDRAIVLDLVKKTGIKIIDVHQKFNVQSDPLSLFQLRQNNNHYNEKGYNLVAKTILENLYESI